MTKESLYAIQEYLDITQYEMAHRTGVHRKALWNCLQGRTQLSNKSSRKIRKAFRLTIIEINKQNGTNLL